MNEWMMDWSMESDHTTVNQATILVVEDDEGARNALHYFLQRAGYKVISVGSVEAADKCIKERGSENIAVIISDIHLDPVSKELEGYAFFLRWSAEDPDLPFILISGDRSLWDLPAVRAEDVCFLAKPFNLYDLLATVRCVMRE